MFSNNSEFQGSVVLITGGTGSFGATATKHFLKLGATEVRVFSRDEAKQDWMRRAIGDPRARFYVGDVRDDRSVSDAIRGVDFVFHAAALKQVPSCEFFPEQAVATNVLGSLNIVGAAAAAKVRAVVLLSTDKAVYPVNAMGMTKALMEKTAQSFARRNLDSSTTVSCVRYGNVLCSRGSVIPLFVEQLRQGKPMTITTPEMTRFLMSLDESMRLVEHALANGRSGDLFIRKAPACSVETLARAVAQLLEREFQAQTIGSRHGEKLFETLLTGEERARGEDQGAFFRVPLDARSLDYELFVDEGDPSYEYASDYTSQSTHQLDVPAVVELLRCLPEFIGLVD